MKDKFSPLARCRPFLKGFFLELRNPASAPYPLFAPVGVKKLFCKAFLLKALFFASSAWPADAKPTALKSFATAETTALGANPHLMGFQQSKGFKKPKEQASAKERAKSQSFKNQKAAEARINKTPAPALSNIFLAKRAKASLTAQEPSAPSKALADPPTETQTNAPSNNLTSASADPSTETQTNAPSSNLTSPSIDKQANSPQEENTRRLKRFGFFKKNTPYMQYSNGKFHVIYSRDFNNLSPALYKLSHSTFEKLSHFFRLKPDFRNHFTIFLSSRWQIPLHYASGSQFLLSLYPFSGLFALDQAALSHPTQSLLTHEMSHLYQLSQTSDRMLWPFFGLFATRNFILSSFALEGSAVFNESFLSPGGRLSSGWFKAFALSQIQAGLSLSSFLKPRPDPFFSQTQYAQGAYFFAFLHNQYGEKAQSRFFYESGKFFPAGYAGLSASLKRAFGKDLKTLFKEYKQYYAPLAQGHKFLPQKALMRSQIFTPLNSDSQSVYFLISDQKSPPRLIAFNKKTGQISQRAINIPLGKLFYKKGEWLSAGCERTSSSSVECSLFKEGFRPIEKFRSRLVMDMKGQNSLSLDSRQNLLQSSLLVNDRFYGKTHSSAVFGPQGEIYRFKQEGDKRTLYRDKSPLFQVLSHYGYPVEADEEGLWFIGPTPYGSGLFVYKEGQGVSKIGGSDAIIHARRIDENRFLVCEIRPTAYEYKILNIKENQPSAFPSLKPPQQESFWAKEKGFKENLKSGAYRKSPAQKKQALTQKAQARAIASLKTDGAQKKAYPSLAQAKESAAFAPHARGGAALSQNKEGGLRKLAQADHPPLCNGQNQEAFCPAEADDAPFQEEQSLLEDRASRQGDLEADDAPFQEEQSPASDLPAQAPLPQAYNSFKALNLINFSLIAYPEISLSPVFALRGFYLAPSIQWADPLHFNELRAQGLFRSHHRAFKWTYIYKKYRPSIQLSLRYNEMPEIPKNGALLKRLESLKLWDKQSASGFYSPRLKKKALYYRDMAVELLIKYPLAIKPFWSLTAGAGFTKGLIQIESKSPPTWLAQFQSLKSYIKHRGELDYSYKRKYQHAWSFHKKRQLRLFYETLHVFTVPHSLKTGFQADMTDELGKEWFISLGGRAVRGIFDPATPIPLHNKAGAFFYREFPKVFPLQAKSLYQADFHLLKVLNWAWRPLTLPLSLQRTALFAGASFLSADIYKAKNSAAGSHETRARGQNNFQHYGLPFIGAEWEWNLLDQENLIFKTGFSYNYAIELYPTSLLDSLSEGGWSGFWAKLTAPDGGLISPGGSYWSFWIKGKF